MRTNVGDILAHLINGGLPGLLESDIKRSHYTGRGAECVIEFDGQFYRITLEHMPTEERREPC